MWDRIKRLWHKPKETGLTLTLAEQHRQMEYFWDELHARHFDGLAQKVKPFLQSDDPAVVQKALRLLGLEQFHQYEYAKALPYFAQLAEQTQTTTDWFNVVTSATLAGNLEQGEAAFNSAIKNHARSDDSKQPSVAMLHYFYACALRDVKAYERAFEHVDVLRAIYEKLPNTLPEQLHLRGLAPLGHILDLFVDVLAESGDIPGAVVWLREFARELDAPARLAVDEAIARLQHKAKHSRTDEQEEKVEQTSRETAANTSTAMAAGAVGAENVSGPVVDDELTQAVEASSEEPEPTPLTERDSAQPKQADYSKGQSGDLFEGVEPELQPTNANTQPTASETNYSDPLDAKP